MMQDAFTPVFGRHETFHPRYAWLKKAYDEISNDNNDDDGTAFRSENATVRFGVGKNMVNAIKFWSLAFKITTEIKNGVEVTPFGEAVFSDDGIDPYLERPETLWLLHWWLLSKSCRVPVWWIILNEIASVRIKTEALERAVTESVQGNPKMGDPSLHSVKRDVSVFMHMYTSKNDKLTPEEYLDCPFRNMRLVRHEGEYVRFVYGPKPGLTPAVVAYACADFARQEGVGNSISAATLASGVGNIFKLNEGDLADFLRKAARVDAYYTQEINGATHMVFAESAGNTAAALLKSLKPIRRTCVQ